MNPNNPYEFLRRPPPASGQSLPARILAFLLSVGLLVVGFMFSLVALAVVAVVGLLVAGWFWWKTRALRQAARQQPSHYRADQARRDDNAAGSGVIIEGEVVRERDEAPRHLN